MDAEFTQYVNMHVKNFDYTQIRAVNTFFQTYLVKFCFNCNTDKKQSMVCKRSESVHLRALKKFDFTAVKEIIT